MKINLRTILFMLCLLLSVILAREVKVEGRIVDSNTDSGIENVNIFLDSGEGCTSDSSGYFYLMLEVTGKINMSISHIGYREQKMIIDPDVKKNDLVIKLVPCVIAANSEIMVTGSRLEKNKMDLTIPGQVVYSKNIEREIGSNLTDLLHKTVGFRQVWEYHSPLLLRGMSSKHLLVMIDGNRRVGTFPGGFMGQNINIFDLQKVEVLRGPSSVLYGAGALAGTINLISRDVMGNQGFRMKFSQSYGTNNNENLSLLCLNYGNQRVGVNLSGKFRKSDDYVMGNGETADNSMMEDKDLSARVGIKINNNQQLVLTSKYHDGGPWGKPIGFNNKPWVEVYNEETAIHNSFRYSIKKKGFVQKIVAAGYLDQTRRDYHKKKHSVVTGKVSQHSLVKYKLNYSGGRFYTVTKPAKNIDVAVGVDGYMTDFSSPEEQWDHTDDTHYKVDGADGAGTQSVGAYSQCDWSVLPQYLSISAGLRYDMADVDNGESGDEEASSSQSAFSGSVGLLYNTTENTRLSINVGRAFRMPDVNELFNRTVSCIGIKLGNPDLKPEYSWDFDLGYRGKWLKGEFEVAAYTNLMEDFINQIETTNSDDYDYTYENIGKSRISGVELSGAYHFFDIFGSNSKLTLSSLTEYIYGVDVTGKDSYFTDGDPLHGIPPFRFDINFNFTKQQKIVGTLCKYFFEMGMETVAKQDRVPETVSGSWGAEKTAGYTVYELKTGITFTALPARPQINIKINNLFDKNYRPFGSYLPAMGRNIKIMLKVEL